MEEEDMPIFQAVMAAVHRGRNDSEEDSEDDDEEDENDCPLRVGIQVESWRRMGDPTFKKHFRMDTCTFQTLLEVVGGHMERTRIIRRGMPIDISLRMTLWILATPDTFRSVGVKFGVLEGSVHNQYKTMIQVLKEIRSRYTQWPSENEQQVLAAEFEDQYGYPGVIGCIDCCHIRMTAPLEQPVRYINRHHDYSIMLQGVCDHRLVFRDVCIGQPGSVGDVRTFHRSRLSGKMLRLEHVMGEFHLLGDGAYPCLSQLLTPYRDYGHLTEQQRLHNYILSRSRSCIERAFALLKGKWRRLKYFQNYCLEYGLDHIMACVVLHNFIILEGEEYDVVNPDPVIEWVPGQYTQMLEHSAEEGEMKREYIAAMFQREQ